MTRAKKILLISGVAVVAGVAGYIALYMYNSVAGPWIEKEIREAGLNPDDYDLSGVAPWNIRVFVTNKEIEKTGLNPENFDIKGKLTADEARKEVTRQEIVRQLAEYDMTIDDVDLSGVDLLSLSPEEIQAMLIQQVTKKIESRTY